MYLPPCFGPKKIINDPYDNPAGTYRNAYTCIIHCK